MTPVVVGPGQHFPLCPLKYAAHILVTKLQDFCCKRKTLQQALLTRGIGDLTILNVRVVPECVQLNTASTRL